MTAPSTYLPVQYDAPPVNPPTDGLYLAATMLDRTGPDRLLSGVDIWSMNCATGWGTWDVEPCADPGVDDLKDGERASVLTTFAPLTVWGYDQCDPTEDPAEITARALQNVRLHEQNLVETHFATRILADAGAPTAAADLVAAIGELEVQIGDAAIPGVIHLSRRYAAALDAAGVIVGSGPIPRTRLGTALAFGSGYDVVLGTTLVATGPVTVFRSEIFQQDTLSPDENLRAAIAERTVVASYECLATAVEIGGTP
ncbi:hypothetical protein [Rhodococcus aetherivorans]|uniref:hypothetical protein n=1 Tax=Rhodococcus aetherivorans TaxID=191292 RepID=UPI001E367982|nr:hypothetical protein [Rhodococcus aetherivorans]UGQ43399.1 hypothetical protein LRQ66_09010 [Rhodococcus aetherivorans]